MNRKEIRSRLNKLSDRQTDPGWEIPVGNSGGYFVKNDRGRFSVVSCGTFGPVPFPRNDTRLLGFDLPVTKAAAMIEDLIDGREVTR